MKLKSRIFSCISMMIGFYFAAQKVEPLTFDIFEKERLKKPKPVLVFIHTDWCAICRLQEKEMNKNEDLMKLITVKTYFLGLNSEKNTGDIIFFKKRYRYHSNGNSGLHDLAFELSGRLNKQIYPLWVILNTQGEVIFRNEGLLRENDLKKIISLL